MINFHICFKTFFVVLSIVHSFINQSPLSPVLDPIFYNSRKLKFDRCTRREFFSLTMFISESLQIIIIYDSYRP